VTIEEEIRKYGRELGADAVGIAAAGNYRSPRSPDLKTILPQARSLVVLGYREVDGGLESGNPRVKMAGRLAVMDLAKKNDYFLARLIEDRWKARSSFVLTSFPLDMSPPAMGLVGDISLRHAAVAAGLGVFGRHNLVIHPELGTRVIYGAVLTELALNPDPPLAAELCKQCGLCVESCPAKALEEEGRTDQMKCLRVSQPFGIGALIGYLRKFIGAAPEEQKAALRDPLFLSLYQAPSMGFQYGCFQCETVCPAGRRK
jgi:epoxyqueuosine reductase QueG